MPRLMCDGNGNLMVDDPEHKDHGQLVKFHEGTFVPIEPGDRSHNDTHHQQFVVVDGTRDAEGMEKALDAAGEFDEGIRQAYLNAKVNAGAGENMHHYETQEDDEHYDENAPRKTATKLHPDVLAPTVTGHTAAWQGDKNNA